MIPSSTDEQFGQCHQNKKLCSSTRRCMLLHLSLTAIKTPHVTFQTNKVLLPFNKHFANLPTALALRHSRLSIYIIFSTNNSSHFSICFTLPLNQLPPSLRQPHRTCDFSHFYFLCCISSFIIYNSSLFHSHLKTNFPQIIPTILFFSLLRNDTMVSDCFWYF